MKLYFNDNDQHCAAWLRNLWPEATVSTDSVVDVMEVDADRVHLFAGIGGWELALQMAGWPEDMPVWTGSCPCQPFSAAGKRKGTDDARHLWPDFYRLIDQHRPPVVFGEQVASKDGREWLVGVRADLEGLGYVVGAADLCAAGVGAPHIRQRLYWGAVSLDWLADAQRSTRKPWRPTDQPGEGATAPGAGPHAEPRRRGDTRGLADTKHPQRGPVNGHHQNVLDREDNRREEAHSEPRARCEVRGDSRLADGHRDGHHRALEASTSQPDSHRQDDRLPVGDGNASAGLGGLEHANSERRPQQGLHLRPGRQDEAALRESGLDGGLGDTDDEGSQGWLLRRDGTCERFTRPSGLGAWGDFDLVECLDGKTRRFEPGSFPLAHGVPGRVGRIRAYGNSIVPEVGASFIMAFMEALSDLHKMQN